jgi:Ca-activated chloride channel homolog
MFSESRSAHLTQTYVSKAAQPTEVKYVFQLPPDASVHAFEAIIDATKVIKGIAKEKRLARAEYEEAKQQGRAAALLEQNTVEGMSNSPKQD